MESVYCAVRTEWVHQQRFSVLLLPEGRVGEALDLLIN